MLLSTLLLTTSPILADPQESDTPTFAPPVVIEAAGAAINADGSILYPSPVLIDVDADGALELVVGDLWGHLYVHERIAVEGGNAILWGERALLNHATGANVQLPNW